MTMTEALHHRTRRQVVAAKDAAPGRYLAFEDGAGAQLLALTKGVTHIGRGLTADVRIDDHRIARLHAIITIDGDRVRVLDGRSLDGTFVNGQQAVWSELRDGDVLVLGPVTMQYVEVAPRPACSGADGRVRSEQNARDVLAPAVKSRGDRRLTRAQRPRRLSV
jgi:hypothetical protein